MSNNAFYRSEVLNLSEENFALRKELEKFKSKGVQQTEQRPETSVRRKNHS